MAKTIRWGIIGCGNVTEVKSGPGFQKASNSALVAVMRRDGDLARDYAQRHGVPKWYDEAQALIHDPEVDAVYIATPPYAHEEYTLAAAQAGKPIYVEKPMARHHDECLGMIEACESAKVPLFVAYYRRALPRFLKIKELIDTGAIGEVRFVSVTLYQRTRPYYLESTNLPWRVQPELSGGGIFVDLASHILDILDFLLGSICEAQGVASNHGNHYLAEDIVTGHFVFESGVHGMGTWCFTAFEDCDQTEIIGSQGKITYVTFDGSPIVLTTQEGTTEFAMDNPPNIQQPLIQTIVDELNGVGHCPSTGLSAARVNWAMDKMLESYYKR